jgi:hypothetical protein
LSIAAHGHADALSIELRLGGVEVLVDPGTYCYHGEPAWRRYFKGTRAHNTLAIGGEDQAIYGGPFLWLSSPRTVLDAFHHDEQTGHFVWEAHHDGYERLGATHHRRVVLSPRTHLIEVEDWIDAGASEEVTLSYHLGPRIQVSLVGRIARLSWKDDAGKDCAARLKLDDRLEWTIHRGQVDPPLGWYSARFGEKEPTSALVGCGTIEPHLRIRSEFAWSAYQPAVSGNVLVEAGLPQ